jgi:hypothetical protein
VVLIIVLLSLTITANEYKKAGRERERERGRNYVLGGRKTLNDKMLRGASHPRPDSHKNQTRKK